MKSLSKSEIEQNILGEWKSELEEMIYVFSDTPSVLKKDSFDLLVSNIKLNNYFLTMYCIITENENIITNSPGGEIALDFMFWPFEKKKFGWYLEPAYDYSFGKGHEQSIGMSGGLLISIR